MRSVKAESTGRETCMCKARDNPQQLEMDRFHGSVHHIFIIRLWIAEFICTGQKRTSNLKTTGPEVNIFQQHKRITNRFYGILLEISIITCRIVSDRDMLYSKNGWCVMTDPGYRHD